MTIKLNRIISIFALVLVNFIGIPLANAKDFKLICYQERLDQENPPKYTRMLGSGMPADGTGSFTVIITGDSGTMTTSSNSQNWSLLYDRTVPGDGIIMHGYSLIPKDKFFQFIFINEHSKEKGEVSWGQQIKNGLITGRCKNI